jgi:hypothetical protein
MHYTFCFNRMGRFEKEEEKKNCGMKFACFVDKNRKIADFACFVDPISKTKRKRRRFFF